jgi:hypothetical protein
VSAGEVAASRRLMDLSLLRSLGTVVAR